MGTAAPPASEARQDCCLTERERQCREFLYRSSARQRGESKAFPETTDLLSQRRWCRSGGRKPCHCGSDPHIYP